MNLPIAVYTAAQVRELDRVAIQEQGIPGIVLMKRAGRAVFDAILQRWPELQAITVFCGAGNNGGDGYVVAGLARQKGLDARIVQLAPPEKLQGDARRAWQYARAEKVPMQTFSSDHEIGSGVIVDALLGTGLTGSVRPGFAEAIAAINSSRLPVVAVDIPSGLCSDTGTILGAAIRADLTCTFIGRKRGLYTGSGRACVGELVFDDLSVPATVYAEMESSAELLDLPILLGCLPERDADAHKGHFGHVMIIGGDHGFGGAVTMAAEAALRAGAGLVSVATRSEHVAAVLTRTPEVMAVGVESGQALEPLLQRPSVLVTGPGLGRSPWSEQMFQKAARSGLPLVVDADALNILAEGRVAADVETDQWILTPHPGEAARLLGATSASIQADRFIALRRIQEKYGCTVALKGSGTLVSGAEGECTGICTAGNPGMASGGMGDVLSGIVGGLLAQGLSTASAARLAVCVHSRAADMVAERAGQRGMAATDLLPFVRQLLNGRP